MKDWMIGVNGTFWRHKHTSHDIECVGEGNLVKLTTFDDEHKASAVFVGQIVVVFDANNVTADAPAGGTIPGARKGN